MHTRILLPPATQLLAGAGVFVLGMACSPAAAPSPTLPAVSTPTRAPATVVASAMAAPSAASAAQPFDQQFIDMMVPHHQGAVEMATIAQTRGQKAEIKAMANAIIASQTTELDQMKSWRKAWYGSDLTPSLSQMPMLPGMDSGTSAGGGMAGMSPGSMGQAAGGATTMHVMKDVQALRAAPEPFDRAFIDVMIPHHQSAIAAATQAQAQGQHPEIKTLAQAIIAAQQKEIGQMQQWRTAWFPGQ